MLMATKRYIHKIVEFYPLLLVQMPKNPTFHQDKARVTIDYLNNAKLTFHLGH